MFRTESEERAHLCTSLCYFIVHYISLQLYMQYKNCHCILVRAPPALVVTLLPSLQAALSLSLSLSSLSLSSLSPLLDPPACCPRLPQQSGSSVHKALSLTGLMPRLSPMTLASEHASCVWRGGAGRPCHSNNGWWLRRMRRRRRKQHCGLDSLVVWTEGSFSRANPQQERPWSSCQPSS